MFQTFVIKVKKKKKDKVEKKSNSKFFLHYCYYVL